MEWVKTRKGSESPVYNGYHFKTKGGKNERKYWVCNRCPVRLVTEGRQFYSITNEHNHEPDEKTTVKKAFCKEIDAITEKNITLSQKEVRVKMMCL